MDLVPFSEYVDTANRLRSAFPSVYPQKRLFVSTDDPDVRLDHSPILHSARFNVSSGDRKSEEPSIRGMGGSVHNQ